MSIFGIIKVGGTMSRKKAEVLYHCIMQALYEASTPPVDWKALMASNEDAREAFDFNEHYLPQKEFELIVGAYLASSALPKFWQDQVSFAVYLGPSPTSHKKGENK